MTYLSILKPKSRLYLNYYLNKHNIFVHGYSVIHIRAYKHYFQIKDGNGGKRDVTLEELVKKIEELNRLH